MAVICPRCHQDGRRVEMKSSFLRAEEHAVTVPCDSYPDGTVISEVERKGETAVFKFECPACGLSVDHHLGVLARRDEAPTATESP